MNGEIAQIIARRHDLFASVVSCPYVHRIAGDPASIAACAEALRCELTAESDRIAAGLALLHVTRRFAVRSSDKLLSEQAHLAALAASNPSLQLRAKITRAALLYTNVGDYKSAIVEFETSATEAEKRGDEFAYALASKGIGDCARLLGRCADSEVAYENALVTFRRQGLELLTAFVINNLAILRKQSGEYNAALRLLRRALGIFERLNVPLNIVDASNNIGFICARTGDWKSAQRWFEFADGVKDRIEESHPGGIWICVTPLSHLLSMRRRFEPARQRLLAFLQRDGDLAPKRIVALANEFLGELYLEMGQLEESKRHLDDALSIIENLLPESDVMTETLRRRAQLELERGLLSSAKATATRCIYMSRRIGDRYELGAALRVLGETYVAQGSLFRAKACFAASANGLRTIHECYELMRTLYAQGVFLSKHGKRDEAEISLLEARQLAKKLELDYYQALIAIALVDALTPKERWSEATSWLQEATMLRDNLEGIDHDRVEKKVQRVANELQVAITRTSVREAETLKTICRVYEDARFPIVEMRADLAYQVAQSAGGMSLFLAARRGGGYHVPLTYNIAVNDAKDIVRRFDESRKETFLRLNGEARVLALPNSRTLVAVPCQSISSNGKDKSADVYALCTCFDKDATVGPRQIEILCASAEALVRLVDEEDERHARPTDEEISRARHPRGSFKDILTIDPGMIKVIKLAERAASSVAPILLQGETGVGKELFARAIHESSKRKDGPFVAVNAGGMPVSLLESELFGHVKGAFTDAGSDRQGFVDTARGGTLFLDEIGEMGEELQVKLLRLLENGEYRRLGESSMRKADVRVISATNKELAKEVDRGRFRRDLYYRVSPLRLTIPPLRLRAVDIQLMVRHFLRDCARMNGIGDRMIEIDVKAMEALELYDWPGNVRELHNEILRVVSLIGRGDLVRFSMLSEHIQQYLQAKRRGADGLLERSVEQYERRLILHALENNDWNHLRTAESIGVPRTTLLAKLKRLNIPAKL